MVTAAQFLTLGLYLIVATQIDCVDLDGPGHAPLYLDVSLKMKTITILSMMLPFTAGYALELNDFAAFNVKLGYPYMASAECGVIIVRTKIEDSNSANEGLGVYLEPGITATKAKVGFQIVQSSVMGTFGVRVQTGVMRTYGMDDIENNNKTFIGLEIETPIIIVVPQFGVWRQTQEDSWIITAGLGLGF